MKSVQMSYVLLAALSLLLTGCSDYVPEECGDGTDNDSDGFIDCEDQDCHLECPDIPDDDDSVGDDDDSAGDDDDSVADDDDSVGGDDDDSTPCTDADGDNWCAEDDCDDSDPQSNPVGVELCDGNDNDCNGLVDDGAADAPSWHLDADNDGYGAAHLSVQACLVPAGYVANSEDCDDLAPESYPGATELCDQADNNCDTFVDEGVLSTWYVDSDSDGFGDAGSAQQACSQPGGTSINGADCNDADATISPSAVEQCDSIDNDCDQQTDEAGSLGSSPWYVDADGDGFGTGTANIACSPASGEVDNDDDCDDAPSTGGNNFPGNAETCDGSDNNCDGNADEGQPANASTWYADLDGDGAGGTLISQIACSQPAGFVALIDADDCDDLDATAFPGGVEVCDGADNNCAGGIDEGVTTTFFADSDGDGYGDPGSSVVGCFQPPGYSSNSDDCDDGSTAVSPGSLEVCDNLDNDCNGPVDDNALDAQSWYLDDDADGYGAGHTATVSCTQPSGTVANDQDCDDDPASGADNYPTNPETCDGLDNNCNLIADEGFDGDSDGVTTCGADGTLGTADDDCDDTDGDNSPNLAESCDGADNNCDTVVDEGQLGTGAACAGQSCLAILTASGGSAADGTYFIDPDGIGSGEAVEALPCDMSNGGWTEIEETTDFPYQTYTESDSTEFYVYVVSDAFIAALKTVSSEASQSWDCHTVNVDQNSAVSNWVVFDNGPDGQFSQCLSPQNNDERSSSGTVTDFDKLPAREWHPEDCGDSNEACQHNVDSLFLR